MSEPGAEDPLMTAIVSHSENEEETQLHIKLNCSQNLPWNLKDIKI